LIQELIAEGCHGVTRYQPTGDKTMRMHAQTAMIENGFVHIPETAPWVAEYLHEMTVFPNGKMMTKRIQPHSFSTGRKRLSPGSISSNIIAGSQQQTSSAANRNPPKPYLRRVAWNGSPSRRTRAEPPSAPLAARPQQNSS
jgi:hypothetical protein